MSKIWSKRFIRILLALFLLPVLALGFWHNRQVHQQRLDDALVAAVEKNDTDRAIALLEARANANAIHRFHKPLTFKSVLAEIWGKPDGNKTPQQTPSYPTALLLLYTNHYEE